jgi:predicted enzyme related to lactoylglutathione lyase
MASTRLKRARASASSRKAKASRGGARARTGARKKATTRAARPRASAAKRNGSGTLTRAARPKTRVGKVARAVAVTVGKAAGRLSRLPRPAAAKRATPRRASKTADLDRAMEAPPAVTNGVGLLNCHIDYTSQDLEGVKRFYTEELGFTNFHHDQSENYLMVRTTPMSSIGFMPPMPGPPEEWRPPREPALYLMVEDVDRAYRELSARGVEFEQAPQDMPWMHRVALLRDPEGRRVCLAQVLTR